jgi:LCP family protein required for cell wall assembly
VSPRGDGRPPEPRSGRGAGRDPRRDGERDYGRDYDRDSGRDPRRDSSRNRSQDFARVPAAGGPGRGPNPGRGANLAAGPEFDPEDDVRPVRHAREKARRRRWLRVTLYTVVFLMVVAAGGSFYVYHRLNANIASSALYSGTTGSAGVKKADAEGRFPINLLVIGTDSRADAADCKLGGACGDTAGLADVELLVHVSADRSNITAMSIPRDTMTELPGCEDADTGQSVGERYGQINSSLVYGPGCTVAAVHQLTGITIDHFAMVDFSGVIAMSDATGGVQVCVNNNVYDDYSHLKLSKGKHTLKGEAALEFVRTRHGFGDGSDLGRADAQHAFLSGAIQAIKAKGTLLNPTKLLGVADAATKALTVDDGLDSIPKLISMAKELNKVDSDRITFTTMQTAADPSNKAKVVPAAAATKLFATIVDDRSLSKAKSATTATPSASASATPVATPTSKSYFSVKVQNHSGVDGRASKVSKALKTEGYLSTPDATSADLQPHTQILYSGKSQLVQAQQLATDLDVPTSLLKADKTVSVITVAMGEDWTTGTKYPALTKADKAEALSGSHAVSAASKSSCVPVSTYVTSRYNGVHMSPIAAYALATKAGVKDSDK